MHKAQKPLPSANNCDLNDKFLTEHDISWKKTIKLNQKADFPTTTTIFSNLYKAAFWKFYSFIVQVSLHFSNAISKCEYLSSGKGRRQEEKGF